MTTDPASRIPRNRADDYTPEAAAERRAFIEARTEARLDHVGRYAFDPKSLPGNIENFIGAAQVPIGLAGPLRINGERAQGEFYIPMATTEGTLVASYNRGMRLITECGGAKATVVARSMQRSPVFLFEDALEAREFGAWVDAHFEAIKARPPRQRRARASSCRSSSSPSARRGTCGSISPPATPPARTCPARRPRRLANGSAPTGRAARDTFSRATPTPTRSTRR